MRRKGPKVLRETGHEPGTEQATRAAVTRLVSTLGHAGPRVNFPTSRFPSNIYYVYQTHAFGGLSFLFTPQPSSLADTVRLGAACAAI